jgi:hypothetical protein
MKQKKWILNNYFYYYNIYHQTSIYDLWIIRQLAIHGFQVFLLNHYCFHKNLKLNKIYVNTSIRSVISIFRTYEFINFKCVRIYLTNFHFTDIYCFCNDIPKIATRYLCELKISYQSVFYNVFTNEIISLYKNGFGFSENSGLLPFYQGKLEYFLQIKNIVFLLRVNINKELYKFIYCKQDPYTLYKYLLTCKKCNNLQNNIVNKFLYNLYKHITFDIFLVRKMLKFLCFSQKCASIPNNKDVKLILINFFIIFPTISKVINTLEYKNFLNILSKKWISQLWRERFRKNKLYLFLVNFLSFSSIGAVSIRVKETILSHIYITEQVWMNIFFKIYKRIK